MFKSWQRDFRVYTYYVYYLEVKWLSFESIHHWHSGVLEFNNTHTSADAFIISHTNFTCQFMMGHQI